MRRLKNILVALNGSPSSFHALEESIRLARWGKGRVTAITVAPPYEGDLSLVGVKNIREAKDRFAEDILGKAMEIADAHSAPIKVIYEEGEAHCKILEHARTEGSELLVLGAGNRTSIAGLILGSVGSRVVEHSPIDILAIPENAPIAWERILLIADGSEYGKNSAELALELAASYGSDLKALFLPMGFQCCGKMAQVNSEFKSADEASQSLKARAGRAGIRCQAQAAQGRMPLRIADHLAKEGEVTLIILGLQRKKRFFGLISGNIADRFIRYSLCPALTVKARHDATTTLATGFLPSAVRL